MTLSVEIEIRWECCSCDFANRGKPVDGTGGGVMMVLGLIRAGQWATPGTWSEPSERPYLFPR